MPSFESLCAREVVDPSTTKPHVLPLYLTSSFNFESIDQEIDVFTKKEKGHLYSRYGNPTVEAVAEKISALECFDLDMGGAGVMFSSGMAALHTLLLASLQPGDVLLTQGNLYGGSTELLLKITKRCGIHIEMADLGDPEVLESTLRSNKAIKMVFFETPANPALQCIDLLQTATIAARYNVLTAVDNTFATPSLQRPLTFGIDFVMHSTTKYLNGHGNSIAGVVVGRDVEFVRTRLWETMKLAGTNIGPMDAWLVHNGMKTLSLRMKKHCANAQQVAEFLLTHPRVERTNYLGLTNHPDHEVASRQMHGYGGMLSFEVSGGIEGALSVLRKVKFCTLAPTLGDVDTLILHPVTSSHLNIDDQMRLQYGITPGLIRLSVGIEEPADIINDLEQALS